MTLPNQPPAGDPQAEDAPREQSAALGSEEPAADQEDYEKATTEARRAFANVAAAISTDFPGARGIVAISNWRGTQVDLLGVNDAAGNDMPNATARVMAAAQTLNIRPEYILTTNDHQKVAIIQIDAFEEYRSLSGRGQDEQED